MSIQAVAWAIEQEDVPARPALVLISIANHADHTNGYCWLKAETIAREARCKPRSVFRFIGALVRNGYIRRAPKRGEDGKQRANDYWIMFGREERPWDWGAHPDADEAESEASESPSEEYEDQVSPSPYDSGAHGENVDKSASAPVEKHAVSYGPCDSGVTRNESLNHPRLIQKKESARARDPAISGALRHYHQPPPEPVAEVFDNAKQIFVYEGTPAYEAWALVMARRNGIRRWHLTTRKLVGDRWRSGWTFPTLFPKEAKTGPPTSKQEPEISDQDADELSKTATGR